jgi:hypothetical protein
MSGKRYSVFSANKQRKNIAGAGTIIDDGFI